MGACKMVLRDNPAIIDSKGFAPDVAGFAWNLGAGEPDEEEREGTQEVFGACAGAALYRREMLEELAWRRNGGGREYFDEDFFLYLEDVDLSWRARLAGWRCLYVPAARAHHWHSASLGEASPWKRYYLGRNRLWVIAKCYPWELILAFWPLMALYDALAALYLVVSGRTLHPLWGRLAGWAGLGKMLPKRKLTQRARCADLGELRPLMERLASPWKMMNKGRQWRQVHPRG